MFNFGWGLCPTLLIFIDMKTIKYLVVILIQWVMIFCALNTIETSPELANIMLVLMFILIPFLPLIYSYIDKH